MFKLFSPHATAVVIKKVLGVYTHSMETIYLYLRVQVDVGTFFMKSPVVQTMFANFYLTMYILCNVLYHKTNIY